VARRGYKKSLLPDDGEAFLVPIWKQLYTFCWVVGLHAVRDAYQKGGSYKLTDIRIACSTWTGSKDALPTQAELDSLAVRDHFENGKLVGPLVMIGSEPPPKRWKRVGTVKKPRISTKPLSHGGFTSLQRNVEHGWRFAREPDKLAADNAADDAKIDAENAAEDAELDARIAKRKGATLAALGRIELLPDWEGLATARRRATVDKLLRELVANLRELPGTAKRAHKLAAIEATVEKINNWSGCSEIDTPEREALATAIDDIGHAAGLRGHDLAGPYRDW
jgi:hypothetical protein